MFCYSFARYSYVAGCFSLMEICFRVRGLFGSRWFFKGKIGIFFCECLEGKDVFFNKINECVDFDFFKFYDKS